ncbi:MAG TPA: PAS domain-containing protein, partial [Sphingomonas sp.]|nr:PAS domain-containing protein [Sphingomonas sp.]
MIRSLRSLAGARSSVADAERAGDEELLRGQRAQLMVREFEEQGSGWFWQTDRDGCLTYLSAKVASQIGLADGGIGATLTTLFQIDSDSPETERTLGFHLSSRTSFSEYSVCAVDGERDRWWSISGRPIVDAHGNFQGFVGWGSDLTAKRRSEAE